MGMWWVCSAHVVGIQWACGGHVVGMQWVCGGHAVGMWCASSVSVVGMQWVCGGHVVDVVSMQGHAVGCGEHAVGMCYLLRPLPERLQETEQALSCYIPFLNTASVLLCLFSPGMGTTCLFILV